jgi:hypothetical protein
VIQPKHSEALITTYDEICFGVFWHDSFHLVEVAERMAVDVKPKVGFLGFAGNRQRDGVGSGSRIEREMKLNTEDESSKKSCSKELETLLINKFLNTL